MLSKEQRQAIRERVNRATPGPWSNVGKDIRAKVSGVSNAVIASCNWNVKENAEFIAHAREDIPAHHRNDA
jgi:hypothetical protein